jgi:hypothetical protein
MAYKNSIVSIRQKIMMVRGFVLSVVYLSIFLEKMALFSVPAAAVIILMRILSGQTFPESLYIICIGMCLSFLSTGRKFLPEKRSEKEIAAWLDYKSGSGGFLMAIETDERILDKSWKDVLEKLEIVKIDIKFWSLARPLLSSFVLLALAIVIPLPEDNFASSSKRKRLDISERSENLKLKAQVLGETGIIPDEKKDEILAEIKKLEENNSALEPGKVFENLDALEAALKDSAENAFANLANIMRTSAELNAAISKLEKSDDENAEAQVRQIAEKIQEMLNNNAALRDMLVKGGMISENSLRQFMDAKFPCDTKTLAKIAESMQTIKMQGLKSISKICKAGLCSKSGEELKEYLSTAKSGAADFCLSAEGKYLLPEQEAELYGCPGQGGVSRGRGDAPMFFGSESPDIGQGEKYKIESDSLNPEIGENVGISFSAPEVKPSDEISSGQLTSQMEKGGTAKKQQIPHSEKKVIKNYFSE